VQKYIYCFTEIRSQYSNFKTSADRFRIFMSGAKQENYNNWRSAAAHLTPILKSANRLVTQGQARNEDINRDVSWHHGQMNY
jgi:hypothetical protein